MSNLLEMTLQRKLVSLLPYSTQPYLSILNSTRFDALSVQQAPVNYVKHSDELNNLYHEIRTQPTKEALNAFLDIWSIWGLKEELPAEVYSAIKYTEMELDDLHLTITDNDFYVIISELIQCDIDRVGYFAAKRGLLNCLMFALLHKGTCKNNICSTAAANGHLECLMYARTNRCLWDEDTCINAAANGHLGCLKYAHENGCSWDDGTCAYAAENGHLDCLKYAVEHNCECGTATCTFAAKKGHLDCLKFAIEHHCP
jgi:hypothetical protein